MFTVFAYLPLSCIVLAFLFLFLLSSLTMFAASFLVRQKDTERLREESPVTQKVREIIK